MQGSGTGRTRLYRGRARSSGSNQVPIELEPRKQTDLALANVSP